jgi:hypothetical protein
VLRNRNDGSGLMLNGFWVKPKKALYINHRRTRGSPFTGLLASYHARGKGAGSIRTRRFSLTLRR